MKKLNAYINKDVLKRMRHNHNVVKPGDMLKDNDLVLIVCALDDEHTLSIRYGTFIEEDEMIIYWNSSLDYANIRKEFKWKYNAYTHYIVKIYRLIDGEAHHRPNSQHQTLLGEPEKDPRYELVYEDKELMKRFKLQ